MRRALVVVSTTVDVYFTCILISKIVIRSNWSSINVIMRLVNFVNVFRSDERI